MSWKELLSPFILLALFCGAICSPNHQHETPHLCDEAYSSEECAQISVSRNRLMGPATPDDFEVKYILYNKHGKEMPFTYDTFDSSSAATEYTRNAEWKVLIHGFLNNKGTQFPVNVRKAYQQHMMENKNASYNVLVFDWSKGACASFSLAPYHKAAENVEVAGQKLGNMLVKLNRTGIVTLDNVHLIGHSLGSHVAGQAARRVFNETRKLLWRISALDPAGPLFWRNIVLPVYKPHPRLRRDRVLFLDVYHTSKMFGGREEIGDVDFYVNGGEHQPSCEIDIWKFTMPIPKDFLQVCSHNYATEIFARSINDKTMLGCTGCYSYDEEFKEGKCQCEDHPVLGEFVTDDSIDGYPYASGRVFIDTPRDTSVGSNYLKMLWDNGILKLLWKGWNTLCF